jgi:hypothetical protein
MIEASLRDVDAKLRWANRHLELLDSEIKRFLSSFIEADLDRIRVEYERAAEKPGEHIDIPAIVPPPVPLDLALIAGDCVHSLRSSLDYLVYQLAIWNTGKKPGARTMFPITITPGGRDKKGEYFGYLQAHRTSLYELSRSHRAMIRLLQPYQRGNQDTGRAARLLSLNSLSNADKHRLLQTHTTKLRASRSAKPITTADSITFRVRGGYGKPRSERPAISVTHSSEPDPDAELNIAYYVAFRNIPGDVTGVLMGIQTEVNRIVDLFRGNFKN